MYILIEFMRQNPVLVMGNMEKINEVKTRYEKGFNLIPIAEKDDGFMFRAVTHEQNMIKDYYTSYYPSDEEGKYLDETATFTGMLETLNNGSDVYDYFGEADSVIRERLFSRLAEILNCDYTIIYNKWLSAETEKWILS